MHFSAFAIAREAESLVSAQAAATEAAAHLELARECRRPSSGGERERVDRGSKRKGLSARCTDGLPARFTQTQRSPPRRRSHVPGHEPTAPEQSKPRARCATRAATRRGGGAERLRRREA